jgi:hypothetical protein
LPESSSVLVMAGVASPGPLATRLGPERADAVQELLLRRALAWAEEVAPGAVHVVGGKGAGPGAGAETDADAEGADAEGTGGPRDMATAAARLLPPARREGRLLIAWPELPRWRHDHAEAALGDLADGCQLSLGPVFDGGFYLLALSRVLPALLELPTDAWQSPDALGTAMAAVHQDGLEVGLLRAERALRSPADVQAALADPMLDAELRELLRPAE